MASEEQTCCKLFPSRGPVTTLTSISQSKPIPYARSKSIVKTKRRAHPRAPFHRSRRQLEAPARTASCAPGQNGLAKSNTDPVEQIPSFSESDATSSSRKTILPIETRGSCTSRIAVL
ncbi:uncharacterized protein LOC119767988 [Culex quinquefasciatus]|uniref:uncharacterized protein LOC119767988 n=1 Tax=Culex quinquefasciatus TaxID=7176 RepID=UPI0018E2E9EA|nr:uncharacterized protein LOC119767988 [Culex quinquefasciatus]